jgi:hypothetical protein
MTIAYYIALTAAAVIFGAAFRQNLNVKLMRRSILRQLYFMDRLVASMKTQPSAMISKAGRFPLDSDDFALLVLQIEQLGKYVDTMHASLVSRETGKSE